MLVRLGAARHLGVRPGSALHAERHHAAVLERLLSAHGHVVPPAAAPVPAPRFVDVADAGRAGMAGERANIALYDELLKADLPADERCVFEHLQRVARAALARARALRPGAERVEQVLDREHRRGASS